MGISVGALQERCRIFALRSLWYKFSFLPLYAAKAVPFYSNASNLVLEILNHGRDKPRIAPFMLEALSIWSLQLLGKSHEVALKQYTETLH